MYAPKKINRNFYSKWTLKRFIKFFSFIYFIIFSINAFSQTVIKTRLKNGNIIYFKTPKDFYELIDSSVFNPELLLKNGNYNIKCYSIESTEPGNIFQVWGFRQLSDKSMSQKEFNIQFVALLRKKLNTNVNVPLQRNNIVDLIIQKYISQFAFEKQEYLIAKADSIFENFKTNQSIKSTVELFYESSNSIIIGAMISAFPSLQKKIKIGSYSGFILLKNHLYGINVILGENTSTIEEVCIKAKRYISDLVKLNPNN